MTAGIVIPSPGFFYPLGINANTTGYGTATVQTLNAAGLQLAMFGRCYIDGIPSGSKTISSGGGGSITWATGAVTLNNASSNIDLGLQGVSTSAGPPAQPDGTYTTKGSYTSSAKPTANVTNTLAMASGTQSIAHGDLIAVVWNMTARGGSDSVVVRGINAASVPGFPGICSFNGSVWAAVTTGPPDVQITFDDGTIATLDGGYPLSTASTTEAFATGTNPNERALIFQVPFACMVDALFANVNVADANSGFTAKLYSDPLGTPQVIDSVAFDAHYAVGIAAGRPFLFTLTTPRQLNANTNYAVSLLATGSSNITIPVGVLGAAGSRALYQGGTSLQKGTRNGSSGAFGSLSTTNLYNMGVRISGISPAPTLINSGGLIG